MYERCVGGQGSFVDLQKHLRGLDGWGMSAGRLEMGDVGFVQGSGSAKGPAKVGATNERQYSRDHSHSRAVDSCRARTLVD